MQNQKGFTLVELMVVVVILGILVAIAVPVYNNVSDNANRRAVEANLRTIDGAIMTYQADKNVTTAPTLDNDEDTGLVPDYLTAVPDGPTGATYGISATAPFRAIVDVNANTFGTHSALDDDSLPLGWNS